MKQIIQNTVAGAEIQKLFSWPTLRSWLAITLGSVIMAVGYVLFINPYKIVPGGVYGLGIVLHQLFPGIQVGTFGLMFDIPLMLIALKIFGGVFGSRTIYAALITPLIMNTLTHIIGENPATMFGGKIDLSDDVMISCLFGGVLSGTGIGLMIRSRATSGGTDIVAMIIHKFTHLPFSRGILIVDSAIVVFGIIILGDWKLPLYSLVTIYVAAKVIDYVIDGASYDKLLFVISDQHDKLRSFILEDMGRGGTYIKSSGMYTRNDKEMIFLVVSRSEVVTVQNKIREIDPLSFVVVVNAYETYGDGFKSFAEPGNIAS